MENKKITFLSGNDFANVLTEYSYLINRYLDGYESKIICKGKHKNNYDKKHDYDIVGKNNLDEIREWVKQSEYVIFGEEMGNGDFNTLTYFHNTLKIRFLKEKKVLVWHPGTHYRKNYKVYNKNKNNKNLYKRLYAVDLYRLSPKSSKDRILLPYKFVDIDKKKLLKDFIKKINNPPYLILHSPSNPEKKGTKFISEQIKNIKLNNKKFKFLNVHNKPNDEIIKLKNESLFYIDQYNDRGGFGVASIEALLCSNFTFSRIENSLVGINKFYPNINFPIINLGSNTKSFKENLKKLFDLDKEDLIKFAEKYVDEIFYFYSAKNIVKEFEKNVLLDG